ncbi:MAG: F0F1 ATP synthase subunit B [Microthrixaceae bacterium]
MLALLSILAEGGEKAKETVNPVIPDNAEMVWGAIAFFALLLLMRYVLLPPIQAGIKRREETIRGDEEAAERASVEATQVRRDYDATIAEARAEANRIVEKARREAEESRSAKVREAEDEVAAARQRALADLGAGRSSALASLKGDVGGIAVTAAGKVLGRPLDVGANRSTVDAHVDSTGA